ncbi:thiol peroxidase [Alginatibacterium sediminis]|uniref:Thiol peroxidase n=1 Tax=Alginatibacterium sediminis TaxID=2164068 RepID=A0A420E647_9ALTE|nr:thiol peroxidase [Alginatibacterium sediminis]RKF13273.1 thiol peroxidase [Alginatibacterium sediminis]
MTTVTLQGNPFSIIGDLPSVGSQAPDFVLVKSDLSEASLSSFQGKRLILNIFPSIDTGTCATSVRTFNQKAAELTNTVVLCISADLPFAQARFCGAEGIENVESLSSFRSAFGADYGIELSNGPLQSLLARSVVVLDEQGKVLHQELVGEIADEPNYDAALAVL